MEILIQIFTWIVAGLDLAYRYSHIQKFLRVVSDSSTSACSFLQYQNNTWAILVSFVLFWPLWVYFVFALTTASTWIFWLLSSVSLGILQVIYVTYQIIMISINVGMLTLLKTYQVLMRSRLVSLLFSFSKRVRNSSQRMSRRRQWSKQCEEAETYADFLKARIMETKAQEPKSETAAPLPLPSSLGTNKSPAPLQTLYEQHPTPSSPLRESLDSMNSDNVLNWYGELETEQTPMDHLLDSSIIQDLGNMTANVLASTNSRLKEARQCYNSVGDDHSLQDLLSGVVKRNHLTLEDLLGHNARSLAVSGQHEYSLPTRKLIANYYEEVTKGLDCMAEAPASSAIPLAELEDRINLVKKMKQNMGRTALMLSGGGAQAMYHLGTLRALIDGGVYDDIKVISGASGGSIAAAMCAMKTSKELYEEFCVSNVSTDYLQTGEMKRKNIRWFPTNMEMGAYWLKHGLLVDSALFRRTCEFYYSNVTFEEAFAQTGKNVCITVSASRASGGTAQRLLLNHVSTPNVTLASAVAASCALPGVMAPAKLQTKNRNGKLEPFEVDGVEWIDGSVQADLPFQRISTLFNVSNFIVSQTNFHVAPFINEEHNRKRSFYWTLFQTMEWDIRNRVLNLSRLGLFPKFFGQDMSKVFKQTYHGNVTLVPRFRAMQMIGLQSLSNPTVKDMEVYLKFGQIAAWPYICVIRDMIRLENGLDECLDRLKERCRKLHPEMDLSVNDDLDSRSSFSGSILTQKASTKPRRVVPFPGQVLLEREVQDLRHKLSKGEADNMALMRQVEQLQVLLRGNGIHSFTSRMKRRSC